MKLSLGDDHRRTSRIGQLPMTPMIDVVFLLLVFFLVTANFSAPENKLSSALQTERASASASDLQPQIVEVRRESGVPTFVIGELRTTSRDELAALLRQLPKEPGVAVRVADDVPVSMAVAAMQAAADAGFEKRSYVPAKD